MLERGDWVWSSRVSLRLSVSLHAYRQGPPVTRPLRIPGAGGGKPYYCRQAGIPNPNRFRETRGCGVDVAGCGWWARAGANGAEHRSIGAVFMYSPRPAVPHLNQGLTHDRCPLY